MDRGSWPCTGDRDQDHPHGKEMQKDKMVVWGGLINSCEKKRIEKQRRKGKIFPLFKKLFYFLAALGLCCCTQAFSSCSEQTSHCGGFSYWRAPGLGHVGSLVTVHRLGCPHHMWNLPGSGIKPMSPALAGRFLTAGPPGKSKIFPFECRVPKNSKER